MFIRGKKWDTSKNNKITQEKKKLTPISAIAIKLTLTRAFIHQQPPKLFACQYWNVVFVLSGSLVQIYLNI